MSFLYNECDAIRASHLTGISEDDIEQVLFGPHSIEVQLLTDVEYDDTYLLDLDAIRIALGSDAFALEIDIHHGFILTFHTDVRATLPYCEINTSPVYNVDRTYDGQLVVFLPNRPYDYNRYVTMYNMEQYGVAIPRDEIDYVSAQLNYDVNYELTGFVNGLCYWNAQEEFAIYNYAPLLRSLPHGLESHVSISEHGEIYISAQIDRIPLDLFLRYTNCGALYCRRLYNSYLLTRATNEDEIRSIRTDGKLVDKALLVGQTSNRRGVVGVYSDYGNDTFLPYEEVKRLGDRIGFDFFSPYRGQMCFVDFESVIPSTYSSDVCGMFIS